MSLQEIKGSYAVSKGFDNFNDLVNWCHNGINNELLIRYIDEVMKIYAMECLKLAYENAEFYQDGDLAVLDYDSITNENNIIK